MDQVRGIVAGLTDEQKSEIYKLIKGAAPQTFGPARNPSNAARIAEGQAVEEGRVRDVCTEFVRLALRLLPAEAEHGRGIEVVPIVTDAA